MVHRSSLTILAISLSSAVCLLSLLPSSQAAGLQSHVLGTQMNCRGAQNCSSWLTTNFAGKTAPTFRGAGHSMTSQGLRPGKRSDRTGDSEQDSVGGKSQSTTGTDVADNNNGHGSDLGHVGESNPRNSIGNQGGDQHDDNGHGNDVGHVDSSNPGQGSQNNGNNGSSNVNANGNGKQHDDNGHGNDPDGHDSSNPGKGKGKGD